MFKYSQLTGQVIGAAMTVHRYFGPGYPEIVYKRALMIELEKAGLFYENEIEEDIYYDGVLVCKRRLDLLIEKKVLIETKAIKEIGNGEMNQVLNYLKVFKKEIGLLLNFGGESLYFKRFVL